MDLRVNWLGDCRIGMGTARTEGSGRVRIYLGGNTNRPWTRIVYGGRGDGDEDVEQQLDLFPLLAHKN